MKKAILSIAIALCVPAVWAGDLSNKGEASIFAGGVKVKDGDNHGIWGVNVGYGFAPRATFYGEFSHTPTSGSDLTDYHGGVKFSLAQSDRVEPYALVGAGVGRVSSNTDFGMHFGGGARIYVNSNWGIQPEIRYTHYFNDFSDLKIVRYTGGIFFQWGR